MHIKNQQHIFGQCRDLDIVMPMYNLLECSGNCSMISRSLLNFYKDEVNDDANEDVMMTTMKHTSR